MRYLIITLAVLLHLGAAHSSEREELLLYGDMESWLTRTISESAVIGGCDKVLYEIGAERHLVGNDAYDNLGSSPWATSNVYARVSGVNKTNCSVFSSERDGGGKAALLKTRIEEVKVLGIVNISVIAAGSIYLGSMIEPIRGTKDPYKYLNSGIPFTQRPESVRYDYKVELSGEADRLRMNGFSRSKVVEGLDMPTMVCLLQRRWEDADGNIYAARIGTAAVNYTSSSDWVDDATYTIIYGDATKSPEFIEAMALGHEQRYALNSRGENVPIIETEWADASETPTHVILHFASSHGGAYIGSPGTQLYLDNIRFVY